MRPPPGALNPQVIKCFDRARSFSERARRASHRPIEKRGGKRAINRAALAKLRKAAMPAFNGRQIESRPCPPSSPCLPLLRQHQEPNQVDQVPAPMKSVVIAPFPKDIQ